MESFLKWKIHLSTAASAIVILTGLGFETRAQRPSAPPNRTFDMVRAINRQEMDRLLLQKPLPAVKDEPARRLMLKQISADFRELQNLNKRMMSTTWARPHVDYRFVSNMISQIRSKAKRLKANLNLPQPNNLTMDRRPHPANDEEFRAALMVLDNTIMSFVQNPIFQNTNSLTVARAAQARRDLETMIDLSSDLRKVAAEVGKTDHR